MPFLRLNRDRRGYESTFLLHSPHHGDRPRVLYWYRTAGGVRVGRPPLDEDAIRTIEEQHPEIDFNWSEILAVGAAINIEVEEPLPPRRRGRPQQRPPVIYTPVVMPPVADADHDAEAPTTVPVDMAADAPEVQTATDMPPPRAHDLLEELVGREIATRLHARYSELSARINELAVDEASREAWHRRAEPLNPDLWVTPDEVLSGVQRADLLFDHLRRELLGNG